MLHGYYLIMIIKWWIQHFSNIFLFAETQPQLMLGYAGAGQAPPGAYQNNYPGVGGMPSYQGYSM